MAYIGNNLSIQQYSPTITYFSGNASTTVFTLPIAVVSAAQIIVTVANVVQNPSSAYTVSGNAITFTSAPPAGTNNIWVEYTSLITTYNAISQSPSVIGDITASGGYLAVGSFGNSFIDGTIVDYVTGNGRVTVGPADGLTLYTGGTSARTALATWDQNGNQTLASGSVIKNSSGRPILNQTGGILQVISTTSTSAVATTSSTMVDSGISATITPSSTSSRILVMITCPYLKVGTDTGTSSGAGVAIYNGSGTLLFDSQRDAGGTLDGWTENNGVQVTGAVISKQFVHSPATTSAYTYKIYFAQRNGGTMTLNYASSTYVTMTLMEIAG